MCVDRVCISVKRSEIPSISRFFLQLSRFFRKRGVRNGRNTAIIFEGDAWTIGPAIVGPRNERQFFQPRTMRRISALCRPIPLCSVMRHARIVIDARARFPFHFCATGSSHYSGKSTDNITVHVSRIRPLRVHTSRIIFG